VRVGRGRLSSSRMRLHAAYFLGVLIVAKVPAARLLDDPGQCIVLALIAREVSRTTAFTGEKYEITLPRTSDFKVSKTRPNCGLAMFTSFRYNQLWATYIPQKDNHFFNEENHKAQKVAGKKKELQSVEPIENIGG
jgi:hypothetical protein